LSQIGIITALLPEAACLTGESIQPQTLTRLSSHLNLYVCGMGAERAAGAARAMLQAGMDVLVSWGTAGAVAGHLRAGDLCVPETVIGYDGRIYETAKHWRMTVVNKLVDCPGDIYLGPLADSMRVLMSAVDKAEVGERHRTAIAVDMESAAIAEVARAHEKPCIVIRVVSDSAVTAIPDIAIQISDPYGRVRWPKLLRYSLVHPLQLPRLAAFALSYARAVRTMRWVGGKMENIFA
jgi:adenosylhomocysteine nucleosidase